MSNQLSAVLIAGHSRFLKSSPYRLDFGGAPILDRTLEAFADFDEVIVVTIGEAGTVEDAASKQAKLVHLEDEHATVGAQLRAGAAAINPKSGFAIAICDQALLSRELVDGFAEKFLAHPKKIFVPICQGQIGMPSIFPTSMQSEFQALGDEGSAWPIVRDHGDKLQELEIYETSIIRHIEDLDDYHEMLRLAGIPIPEAEAAGEESKVG